MVVDQPDFSKGAMIALYPPAGLAAQLHIEGGLDADDLHCTVAYLGDAVDVDLEKVLTAAKVLADRVPIAGAVSGHARFTGGAQDVLVALVDSPTLEQLRRDLVDALSTLDVSVPADHGYTAHITLRYLDPAEASPIYRLDAAPVEFGELVVVHGLDWYEFPFTPRDIGPFAREAFAAGWAATNGPMTERVQAAAEVAVQLAREHAGQPDILEATLQLGSLEGTWAELYDRREKLYAKHTAIVRTAWRPLAKHLDIRDGVLAFRHQAGLGEAAADDGHLRALAQAAARNMMQNLLVLHADNPSYQDILEALADALRAAQAEGGAGGIAIGAQQLGVVAIDFELAFKDQLDALGNLDQYWIEAKGWLADIVQGAAGDLGRLLARLTEEGAGSDEMIDAAADLLGSDDLRAVGAVVDLAMGQSMSRGSLSVYLNAGARQADYVTAGDGHVCFPAGTTVATPDGLVPIEALAAGDVVTTPGGPRRLAAAGVRAYTGEMVVVSTGDAIVAATKDHPFWTPRGWVSAGDLHAGDILKTVQNELVQVDRVVHVNFIEPHDVPSGAREERVASGIPSGGLGVPVDTVRFEGYRQISKQEVDRPAADLGLLLKREAQPFERLTNARLKAVLSLEPAVAGEAAEGAHSIAGADPEGVGAVAAVDELRRSSARFGAVAAVEVLLDTETGAAPGAVDVFGVSGLAGLGAGGVPACDRALGNDKGLAADTADLRDRVGAAGVVASPGAEHALPVAGPTVLELGVELDSALSAGPQGDVLRLRPPVAHPGAVHLVQAGAARLSATHEFFAALIAAVDEGHETSLPYQVVGRVQVYNLEVTDQHVFYANGLLVHNCAICQRAEDNNPYPLDAIPAPPRHPFCRCNIAPTDPLQALDVARYALGGAS